jgi:predicted metal-dependent peptidase
VGYAEEEPLIVRGQENRGESAGGWLDCGSGADGVRRPGDGPGGLPDWQADLLRRQVAQEVIAYAKQPGTVSAGMLRRAESMLSPKVDWRRVLAAELRWPVPEVAVVGDTSGSMTAELLAAALTEVEGLLRSLGLARRVRVLACDTAVAPAQRVTSARQIQLVGGGGPWAWRRRGCCGPGPRSRSC